MACSGCKKLQESSRNLENEMGLIVIQTGTKAALLFQSERQAYPAKKPQVYVGASKHTAGVGWGGGAVLKETVLVTEDAGREGGCEGAKLSSHHTRQLLRRRPIPDQLPSQQTRMLTCSVTNYASPLSSSHASPPGHKSFWKKAPQLPQSSPARTDFKVTHQAAIQFSHQPARQLSKPELE